MKIWITGANGMLGSHFQRILKGRHIHFIPTDIEVDISDEKKVKDFFHTEKFSHIINCAAYTAVDKAETEKKESEKVNAIGPHNLAKAIKGTNTIIYHFSTDYVFDGLKRTPYEEMASCSPVNQYARSKWLGENYLLRETNNVCIIRTSWLYGFPGKNFVETMLRLMQEKTHLKVVNDQVGRPTYCEDLALATLKLIELQAKDIFHFANSEETTWHAFACEIKRQALELGLPIKTENIEPITSKEYVTPALRPVYSTLSTNKISALFGKDPRPWKEALKDYLLNHHKPKNPHESPTKSL